MNIIFQEFKMQRKSFLFWCIGVFLLMLAGMTKYTGISASGNININDLMNQFPRIVLAVLGILNLNANNLDGYYAMMSFYSLICACIYASFLGFDSVSREIIDKTQDFLFTKPISKRQILIKKLTANILLLILFCLVNFVSSILAISILSLKDTIFTTIVYFNGTIFFISLLFFFLTSFLSVLSKNVQKGSSYGMYVFLITFLIGILSQMTDKTQWLRIFAPMRYYLPEKLIKHELSYPYFFLNLFLIIIFGILTFMIFEKKEYHAT